MVTSYEKITVHLNERASTALAAATRVTGDNKTDTVNKALLLWDLVCQANGSKGGGVYIKSPGGELERIRIM